MLRRGKVLTRRSRRLLSGIGGIVMRTVVTSGWTIVLWRTTWKKTKEPKKLKVRKVVAIKDAEMTQENRSKNALKNARVKINKFKEENEKLKSELEQQNTASGLTDTNSY